MKSLRTTRKKRQTVPRARAKRNISLETKPYGITPEYRKTVARQVKLLEARLKRRPIKVIFVCTHGMGASIANSLYFSEFLEELGLQNAMELTGDSYKLSQTAPSLMGSDYIVPLTDTARATTETIFRLKAPRSKAEVLNANPIVKRARLRFGGLESTDHPYKQLLLQILGREIAKQGKRLRK